MIDSCEPCLVAEEWSDPLREEDVVELPLLIPGWQMAKLETVAHEHGMTTAAMVRHLLRDFLMITPSKQRVRSTS